MKPITLIVALTLVLAMPSAGRTVKVSEPGSLASRLAGKLLKVDELVVEGAVNQADFKTMARMAKEGKLRKIDLSRASIWKSGDDKMTDFGVVPSRVFQDTPVEEITFGDVSYVPGGGTFYRCPNLRRVVFNGALGHIDGGPAFSECPVLEEIIFNGPVMSTGGPTLAMNCPRLRRVAINGVVGGTYFGPLSGCTEFKGYEVNGTVLLSGMEDWIPKSSLSELSPADEKRVDGLLSQVKGYQDGRVPVPEFIKRGVKQAAYNVACAYALCNRKEKALDALQLAIKAGYTDYSHMKRDLDFDYIRNEARFDSLLASIREEGDKVYLLQKAAPYVKAEVPGPAFTYAPPTDSDLVRVRQFFNLDSIAGGGDEVQGIKNIMYWLHDQIRHDGGHFPNANRNAIDLYKVCKAEGCGINCRGLAIILSELYLAMGWPARFVTCESKHYDTDPDCHVICMVWSRQLGRWLWMDPSFAAYVSDENGELLGIREVRERLIDGRPLVLNEDANHNHENKETKEDYLEYYMAKNLYVLSAWEHSTFNSEGTGKGRSNIALVPAGFNNHKKQNNTSDADYFFRAPEMK
jgi:hypothetical protein